MKKYFDELNSDSTLVEPHSDRIRVRNSPYDSTWDGPAIANTAFPSQY